MADATDFIDRWKESGGAEMANSQTFLNELCTLLDIPHPAPTLPDESKNHYVFEKSVEFNNGDGTTSQGRVDLYKQGSFILESKQGAEKKAADQAEALATITKKKKIRTGTAQRGTANWQKAMKKAYNQAKRYAEAIPDEWPPFLIVVDVGFCIDLYADFSQSGKNYVAFPDPQSYRISLNDLNNSDTQELLRKIWTEPHSLDPSRISAKITRELADRLAKLARSLEGKHEPETVAQFLMRCLFTMFAEDIDLLPKNSFTELLISLRSDTTHFSPMLESLWKTMDTGGFSPILREKIKQFNGSLFKECTAIPLNEDQLELLIEASEADWKDVEPAIFGTLLERALDPVERHKLGAHYTPRAYVERLVMPTIIEPLREEWETAYATATQLDDTGKNKEAIKTLRDFHDHLCNVRVLDPACGSGNFLYVCLELMKRLEGEVLIAMQEFDPKHTVLQVATVDPHQFLGIEINPRAAAITDLVLWIGYLQWHIRTLGVNLLKEPIIRKFDNIECRDAVLAWDDIEPVFDDDASPVTRWDGRTTKIHPVTGEQVPDETARIQERRFINPRKAEWPDAEYIVGNPPFLGSKRMRECLGDAYVDAIQQAWPEVPQASDFVLRWWHIAALQIIEGNATRFGFICTNSISQTFNRRVITVHLNGKENISIVFACADHPWVDSEDGASVRISITSCVYGSHKGKLLIVTKEKKTDDEGEDIVTETTVTCGTIRADLRIGPNISKAVPIQANIDLCAVGMKTIGAAFQVDGTMAKKLGLGTVSELENHIRPYINGKEFASIRSSKFIIDFYGLNEEEVMQRFPQAYQHLLHQAKPYRLENRNRSFREKWWVIGHPREVFRKFSNGLVRYLATIETSKHRFFSFLDNTITPDSTLVTFGFEDAFSLGVLSSQIHVTWALASGGRLGVGNDPRYNKTRCFETFPFPVPSEDLKQRIRDLGEQLDAHRKRQQELHPKLTMTGMYNVLVKLRAEEPLSDKEKVIHEQGLVSVLKQIHDDLDAAVFEAYGWSSNLTDEEILEKLVALNHQRAEEEERDLIRWLRPEFQNPQDTKPQGKQKTLDVGTKEKKPKAKTTKIKKAAWPKTLPARISAVRSALQEQTKPCEPTEIAKRFSRVKIETIEELLETLVEVGQARLTDEGRFVA